MSRSSKQQLLTIMLLSFVVAWLLWTSFSLYNQVQSQKDHQSQHPAVKEQPSLFSHSRRPFSDPYGMYPECVGYEHVKFINQICQKVFFEDIYNNTRAQSTSNASLAKLFELPPGAEANEMINVEAAKLTVQKDKTEPYRVIAMSLFGKNPRYTRGLIRNMVSLYLEPQFAGWKLRVYYDHTIPNQITHLMKGFGVEMYHVQYDRPQTSDDDTSGSFWRFMILLDTRVTRYLMRDSDMKLSVRDASAVNEWIASELPFHVQRDHPAHHNTILAGMWGSVGGYLDPHSKYLFESIPKQRILDGDIRYGGDQDWLRDIVWNRVKGATISHDVFHCRNFDNVDKRGYPHQRLDPTDFVGNMYRPEENFMGVTTDKDADQLCLRDKSWTKG